MRPWTDATGTARPTSAEMLHEQAESDARMAKCDPPYHRLDCDGHNCDDPKPHRIRRHKMSDSRGMDPGLFC